MSVLRAITKPLRDALGMRAQLRDKAKDLPVFVFQSALNGVGQVLLFGDRIRSAIKRLAGGESPDGEAAREERASEAAESRPARREPVIFAPRPAAETEEKVPEAPEVPEVPEVPEAPEATEVGEAAEVAEVAEVAEASASKAPADVAPAGPDVTAKTDEADELHLPAVPVETEPPAVAAVLDKAATEASTPAPTTAATEAPAKPSGTASTTTPRARASKAQTTTGDASGTAAKGASTAAPKSRAKATKATTKATTGATAKAAGQAPAETAGKAAGNGQGGEPLPGYADLTVASLRARLRGKSVEQVHELLDYEKANANRPDVVRLFQNRLSKLQSEV